MPDSLGQALREARRNSGLSFRRFARQAGFSESHLRSVENGHRSVTGDIAAAYDRVLATGGEFAAAAAARTRDPGAPAPGPRTPVPWDQPGTLAVLTGLTSGGEVDRRRCVTASGAALTVLAARWRRAGCTVHRPSPRAHLAAPRLPRPERALEADRARTVRPVSSR